MLAGPSEEENSPVKRFDWIPLQNLLDCDHMFIGWLGGGADSPLPPGQISGILMQKLDHKFINKWTKNAQ